MTMKIMPGNFKLEFFNVEDLCLDGGLTHVQVETPASGPL